MSAKGNKFTKSGAVIILLNMGLGSIEIIYCTSLVMVTCFFFSAGRSPHAHWLIWSGAFGTCNVHSKCSICLSNFLLLSIVIIFNVPFNMAHYKVVGHILPVMLMPYWTLKQIAGPKPNQMYQSSVKLLVLINWWGADFNRIAICHSNTEITILFQMEILLFYNYT